MSNPFSIAFNKFRKKHIVNKNVKKVQTSSKIAKIPNKPKKYFQAKKDYKQWTEYKIVLDSNLYNLFVDRKNSDKERNLKRETINFNIRLTPIEYVYLNTTLMLDTNNYRNKYYQPNYYYSFGYNDWHSDTFGFSYSNYANNLFLDNQNPFASSFLDGTWAVNYKTKIKNVSVKFDASYQPSHNLAIVSMKSSLKLTKDSSISTNYEHYITYPQDRLEISAKTKLGQKFYLEGGVYLYSDIKLQKDYESDYYYKFKYKAEKFSIEYSNKYQNTRWPWRDTKGATFLEGNFRVSFIVTI